MGEGERRGGEDTRAMARRVTVALLVAGMLGTIPSPAAGDALYRVEGRWHTRTVRYFASPEYAADARVGAAAWNASGARIRWVASSRAQARVVIRMDTAAAPPGRTVSNGRRATIRLAPRAALGARAAGLPAWVERFHVQRAIVRELGRVLGLGAEGRRCAAMAPPAGPDACVYRPAEEPWLYRCRFLEPDDAAGAVRLYGGRARAAAPEFCPLEAPPPPVTGLALTPDDAQRPSAATIAWTTPDDPAAASVRITGRL